MSQEVSELAVMRYTVNILYVILAILIIHYFDTMLEHREGGGGGGQGDGERGSRHVNNINTVCIY